MKLASKATYKPASRIVNNLFDMGFTLLTESTMVSDGKFWSRKVFRNGEEVVTVSDEIGDVVYLRDPIVNMYASDKTIARIEKTL